MINDDNLQCSQNNVPFKRYSEKNMLLDIMKIHSSHLNNLQTIR